MVPSLPSTLPGSLRIGQVYLDAHGRLHCLNPVARQLFDEGIPFTSAGPEKASLRTSAGGAVQEADLPLLVAGHERRAAEATFVVVRGERAVGQVTWSAAPLFDAEGQLAGVVGTVCWSPPEPDWEAMAGLAHDLRTPLNALGFLAAALDRRPLSEPQQRVALDSLRAAAERALRIGMDLLEWCRGPAQRGRGVQAGWFTLEPFLIHLAREQSGAAETKGITLTIDLAAAVGWEVNLDRVRLGRLLANVLVNAVRYTGAGSVGFRAAWSDRPEGRSLTVSVVDTGTGISAEEQESIFQPFERGRAGKESDSGGSGLGLAVVDRLVEELGLSLEVCSEFGIGSAFHLRLPAPVLRPLTASEAPNLAASHG